MMLCLRQRAIRVIHIANLLIGLVSYHSLLPFLTTSPRSASRDDDILKRPQDTPSSKATTDTAHSLAYTRYCFVSGILCTNQYYSLRTHPLFRYPTSPCNRPHYCALERCLPPPRYCNIYHTILATAISCKGQPTAHTASTAATPCHHPKGGRQFRLNAILPLPILYGV